MSRLVLATGVIEQSGIVKPYYLDTTGGGGGGSTVTYGTAQIDFDSTEGLNESFIDVTGQATILATSKVEAFIMADDNTPDHPAADHRYILGLGLSLTCGNLIAGTGFTIYARCPHKLHGFWAVRWRWAN